MQSLPAVLPLWGVDIPHRRRVIMIRKQVFLVAAVALLAATACKKSVDGEAKASASTDGNAEASANASTDEEGDRRAENRGMRSSERDRSRVAATVVDPQVEPRLSAWIEGSGLTKIDANDEVRVPLTRAGGQELYAYPIPDGYEIEQNPENVLSIAVRNGRRVVLFTPPKGAKSGAKYSVKIAASYGGDKRAWPLTIALVD
jgi:hypothetical protein